MCTPSDARRKFEGNNLLNVITLVSQTFRYVGFIFVWVLYLSCLQDVPKVDARKSMEVLVHITTSAKGVINMPAKYSFAVYEPTGGYATGARSFASSSAVVLCTISRGKFHMAGVDPATRWFGASFSALSFCCASKALVPCGKW